MRWNWRPDPRAVDTLRALLTPRSLALAHIDDYYRRAAEESRKPVRRRRSIPEPTDVWSQLALGLDPLGLSDRLERPRTDLALLEVALAVRGHYLQYGRYPDRLRAISKQWLPAIPRDQWDQPIAYRLKNGLPVIYSLGPDGKDDGGQPADASGLSPTTRGDLVFGRLTQPLRKQSPRPRPTSPPAKHEGSALSRREEALESVSVRKPDGAASVRGGPLLRPSGVVPAEDRKPRRGRQ